MSRQNYYKYWRHRHINDSREAIIVKLVREVRSEHPRLGTRKLYALLSDRYAAAFCGTGRDALFSLLRKHALLIRRPRSRAVTTWSGHPFHKYRNLVRNFVADAPDQLWVSDITYLRTTSGFLYLSLITDAYSRKIVGYNVADNLSAVNALQALKMALSKRSSDQKGRLIHHSDRGIQYCTREYTDLLTEYGICISMTENGDPLENAIAERVNGILKGEYLQVQQIKSKEQAITMVERAVKLYNEQRPHLSCQMFTPQQVHENGMPSKRLWKTYYSKNKL